MSQFWQGVTAGALPPSVPTSFADDLSDTSILPGDIPASAGSSTPVASVLRVSGDNGIKTIATPNAPGNLTIRFIRGTTVTSDGAGQTQTAITQSIPTDSTLTIQIIVAGFCTTNNDGVGAYGTAVVKNVAGTASLVGTVDLITNADASLAASNITVTTSGANLLVNVVGIAGLSINWGVALPGIVVSD